MTYRELGLQLRQIYPHLQNEPGDDGALALRFLNSYPEYWDLVSEFAREIQSVATQGFESQRWTEKGRLESTFAFEVIRKSKLENLHMADMIMEATKRRVPVTALAELVVEDHKHHHTMELERFRRDNGLEGGERARLTPHYLIRQLEAELMDLIDRRDKETHPDKKEVLNIRIQNLKGELNARGQQTLVQAGGGGRVEFTDEDADRDGVRGSSTEASVEPLPPPKPRMGF